MFDFLKTVTVEGVVGAGLIVCLVLSIFYGSNDLSVNIASGLIGFIGRGKLRSDSNEKG